MSETADQPEEPTLPIEARDLDLASLKALAHPLRVEIFDALATYGSFTASGLAERLGESSGATSYHLRQLERHGFVREVAGKGSSRERWWERTPGSINIGSEEAAATPAGRSASVVIARQFKVQEDRILDDFMLRGDDELPKDWRKAAAVNRMNTRLTSAQLASFVREVMVIADRYVHANKQQNVPGARPVHINFTAFPVMDGDVSPDIPEGTES